MTGDLVAPAQAPDAALLRAALTQVAEPERLSATTLMAAERCLLAAFLSRAGGNPSGDPAIFGNHFHDIAAQVGFMASLLHKETFSPDEVEAIGLKVLDKPEEHRPLSREHQRDVIDLARRWALTASFPIHADIFQVEIPVIHEMNGQTLSGRIDQLAITGHTAEIEDYKTARKTPSQAEVENEHPQLPTYAWHVHVDYPDVDTFILRERYVRSGVVREVILDLEDVRRHAQWLRTTALRVRAAWAVRAFPPTPGKHCKYCPNPAACPLPERARPESIDTVAQAQEQHAAILVEEARLKGRREALRAFLEREDAPDIVQVGDSTAQLKTTKQKRLDKKAAIAAGLDLAPFEKEGSSTSLKIEGAAK